MTNTVRTTHEPHIERQVDDAELLDLTRWGLLVKDEPETEATEKTEAKPSKAAQTNPTTPPAGSGEAPANTTKEG